MALPSLLPVVGPVPKHLAQDLPGERGTCCTQSASSPKCPRRLARPPKCSSASVAGCILHHRAETLWLWRTAFAELPTLMGFVTSKIVLSSPPKRLTQVHEQSVPAPDSRCRQSLLQDPCQLCDAETYSVHPFWTWEMLFPHRFRRSDRPVSLCGEISNFLM